MIEKKMTHKQKLIQNAATLARAKKTSLQLIITGTPTRLLQSERKMIDNYINKEMSPQDALEAAGYKRTDYRIFHKKLVYDKIKDLIKDLDDVLVAKKAVVIKKLLYAIDKHIDDKNGNARFAMQAIQELSRVYGVYDTESNINTQVNIDQRTIDDKLKMRKEYMVPANWADTFLPEEKEKKK